MAHYNLGTALASLGRAEEGITHYRRAIEIDPATVRVHHNLGKLLASRRQYDEAASHFRRALILDADHDEARRNLQTVIEILGEGQ